LRLLKLTLPPFHGDAIAHYAQLIEQITQHEIDGWRSGDTIRTRTVAQTVSRSRRRLHVRSGMTAPAR
jgi:cytochrome P450